MRARPVSTLENRLFSLRMSVKTVLYRLRASSIFSALVWISRSASRGFGDVPSCAPDVGEGSLDGDSIEIRLVELSSGGPSISLFVSDF